MALSQKLASIQEALTQARATYAQAIEQSEQKLEAFRNQHRETLRKSEEAVAALESELEMLEFFEQERRAALVRAELAQAVERHREVVDGANWQLKDAMKKYVSAVSWAGVAMERAFNAAAGYRE